MLHWPRTIHVPGCVALCASKMFSPGDHQFCSFSCAPCPCAWQGSLCQGNTQVRFILLSCHSSVPWVTYSSFIAWTSFLWDCTSVQPEFASFTVDHNSLNARLRELKELPGTCGLPGTGTCDHIIAGLVALVPPFFWVPLGLFMNCSNKLSEMHSIFRSDAFQLGCLVKDVPPNLSELHLLHNHKTVRITQSGFYDKYVIDPTVTLEPPLSFPIPRTPSPQRRLEYLLWVKAILLREDKF